MVFNRKSLGAFLGLLALACVAGSLAWEIVERIAGTAGTPQSLSLVVPVSFDLHVLAMSFRPNLGSLVGLGVGIVLFFLL
jgi:hypothetical protein